MAYILATIAFLLVGLIVGRRWTLVVPPIVWTFVALGIDQSWWIRPGEQLALGTILLICTGIGAAALGVGVHRLSTHLRRTHP